MDSQSGPNSTFCFAEMHFLKKKKRENTVFQSGNLTALLDTKTDPRGLQG